MGFLDLFRSPERQIELENKLLAKPNHAVAQVIQYSEADRAENYEEDGETKVRTVREADMTLRYQVDGEWRDEYRWPSEGNMGYQVGDQVIVKHNGREIVRIERDVRKESPNRI